MHFEEIFIYVFKKFSYCLKKHGTNMHHTFIKAHMHAHHTPISMKD